MTHPSRRWFSRAVFAALLVGTAVARGDAPAAAGLSLQVRGPGDGAAVARAITDELGVAATLIDGAAACPAPCVTVAVDVDHRATITVALPTGVQARSIELPAGTAAATDVVALVVGNLVRDQAGELLAELVLPPAPVVVAAAVAPPAPSPAPPPAPAPAPASRPVAVEGPRPTRYGVGLIPPLAYDVAGDRAGGVAIDVLVGGRRRLHAFNLAGVASVVREDVVGTQLGGVATLAGTVRGAQVAGALAAAHAVDGTQAGGALALVDRLDGVQAGGALAIAGGDVRGTQVGGALAIAGGDVRGTQLGGALAIVAGDVRGTQVGGAVAVASGAVDTQLAGAVSVARRVRGLQVAGALNVAGRVDGVQVAVINVAGGGDGVSIGLLNLVRGGRTELEATVDQDAVSTVVLRHGSRRWHNVYGAGARVDGALFEHGVGDDEVWMYGLGMGPSWQRGATTLDVEAMAWHVVYGGSWGDQLDLLNQLRVVVGHRLGTVGLVGGVAVNVYVTNDPARERLNTRMTTPPTVDGGVRASVWPTAFVGLRL
ncbi:MAG: hypothetical protein R3B06_20010 [Kofleriaceae bacterium]